jgi:hypothetical protein
MNTLATTALLVRLDELQAELNTLETLMSATNPHSVQVLLDDAWDLIVNEMDTLQEILAIDEANQMVDTREEFSQDPYTDYAYGDWYEPADEI